MTGCLYLNSYMDREVLEFEPAGPDRYTKATVYECLNPDAESEGCPYLDDDDIECFMKENEISVIKDWAVTHLAGRRDDKYTRVREMMIDDMG